MSSGNNHATTKPCNYKRKPSFKCVGVQDTNCAMAISQD